VQVPVARRDLAARCDCAFVVERAASRAWRSERERRAVGQRQPLFAREAVQRREIGTAPISEPRGKGRETRMQAAGPCALAQRPLPSESTMMMPMMTASTRNAIFHGLFGYSP